MQAQVQGMQYDRPQQQSRAQVQQTAEADKAAAGRAQHRATTPRPSSPASRSAHRPPPPPALVFFRAVPSHRTQTRRPLGGCRARDRCAAPVPRQFSRGPAPRVGALAPEKAARRALYLAVQRESPRKRLRERPGCARGENRLARSNRMRPGMWSPHEGGTVSRARGCIRARAWSSLGPSPE